MKIGYVRVSTVGQHTGRQDDLMSKLGVEKIFVDKESGAKRERPGLNDMLSFVREGDTLIVESISRLARSTRDLLQIVDMLKAKSVQLVIQKENIDTNTPQGKFMLTVFAALSELEREQILQRQKEGIEAAKKRGVKMGRPPLAVDIDKFKSAYKQWKNGEITAVKCQEILGMKKRTFYKKVKEYEETGKI